MREDETSGTKSRTVRRALCEAAQMLAPICGITAQREAEWLLRHVMKWDALQLVLHDQSPLLQDSQALFLRLLERRLQREPLQYLIGEVDFANIKIKVDARALIPRPETELLVQEAAQRLKGKEYVLDAGTGSGCILLALCRRFPDLRGAGIDISFAALTLAVSNSKRLGLDKHVRFFQGDLLGCICGPVFDMIVSNPPYIAVIEREDLQPEVRDYEPEAALFGKEKGLEVIKRLVKKAHEKLRTGGYLIFEFGQPHDAAVRKLVAENKHFDLETIMNDQAGIPRTAVLIKKN